MWAQKITLQNQRSTPQTAEEKRKQAIVTANVFIDENRARVMKAMDQYNSVAGSNYWTYGYMGSAMVATMAGCLSLGNRLFFLRSYATWISLAGGYFGGKGLLGLHNSYNLASVVNVINQSIDETKKMDEQDEFKLNEYAKEVESLKQMKYDLMPYTTEALEARKSNMQNMSIDDRANALVDLYVKRKQVEQKK